MSDLLFVYGTLRPSVNHPATRHFVERFELVGKGTVTGKLYDFGEYTGLVLTDDALQRINGEIVAVPEDEMLWQALDEYEGFDTTNPDQSLFIRQQCSVQMEDGRVVTVWIYTYNNQQK
jgi:gamma-glutamylcyclotransferase (GGCT)/AIG2-like uncharacterized protein YtfP